MAHMAHRSVVDPVQLQSAYWRAEEAARPGYSGMYPAGSRPPCGTWLRSAVDAALRAGVDVRGVRRCPTALQARIVAHGRAHSIDAVTGTKEATE